MEAREKEMTVGFVPTMGALHPGHLSLVHAAQNQCDFVIVSIFVNPTQFNDSKDLDSYPRTLDSDMEMLSRVDCDAVFAPDEKAIYDGVPVLAHDYGKLTHSLEGAFRPGHFDGVITVVRRLLEIVTPDKAFFGEKDFQQLSIIRHLNDQDQLGVDIVGIPTVRDRDGLALSSRNALLAPQDRLRAAQIARILHECRGMVSTNSPAEVKLWASERLIESPGFGLEYFDIIDAQTFDRLDTWSSSAQAVVACKVGGIRLIDNLRIYDPVKVNTEPLNK